MVWQLCALGIACCVAGIYLFLKNAFEEDKRIDLAILLIATGVCLIGWGTAVHFHLT